MFILEAYKMNHCFWFYFCTTKNDWFSSSGCNGGGGGQDGIASLLVVVPFAYRAFRNILSDILRGCFERSCAKQIDLCSGVCVYVQYDFFLTTYIFFSTEQILRIECIYEYVRSYVLYMY